MKKTKKKVLVIEQNPSLGFVFETILQNSFDAHIVSNPFDAMDILSELEINCIILSIEKQNTQTHSLLKHLGSSRLLKTTPMVVLTDMHKATLRKLYPENEITKIFKKPFNPIEVLEAVGIICEKADALACLAARFCLLNPN